MSIGAAAALNAAAGGAWAQRCGAVFILATLCLGLAGRAAAGPALPIDDPYFEAVGDARSIPDNTVTALAQDRAGFVWIGTPSGLLRFDGYRFRRFQHDPGQPHSLSGQHVRDLLALPDGTLWVGTENHGIAIWQPQTEQFLRLRQSSAEPAGLSDDRILALTRDDDGGVFIGSFGGGTVDYWDPRSGRITAYPLPRSDQRIPWVRSLHWDAEQGLWIGTGSGLFHLPRNAGTIASVAAAELGAQYIYSLAPGRDGQLLIGTQTHGLMAYDPANGSIRRAQSQPGDPIALDRLWVTAIDAMADGELWLSCHGDGIVVLDSTTLRFRRQFRRLAALPGTLASNRGTETLRDRSGMYWLGSIGGGLQKMAPSRGAIRHLRYTPDRAGALSEGEILSLMQSQDGQIWVGTAGNGIDLFELEHGVVGRIRPGQDGLDENRIAAMAQTRDGSVYAAAQRGGLHRRAPGGNQFERLALGPGLRVGILLGGRSGALWAGLYSGGQTLLRFDPDGRGHAAILSEQGTAAYGVIVAMAEDSQQNLWIGTRSGLWRLAQGSRRATRIRAEDPASMLDLDASMRGLLVDRQDRLWISVNGGLFRIDSVNGAVANVRRIAAASELSDAAMSGQLIEDDRGRIWSAHWMYDPATGERVDLDRETLIDFGPSETGAALRTREGMLVFGGSAGLRIVDPERFARRDFAAPLVTTAVRMDGVEQAVGANPAHLQLGAEHRSLQIEYAALDFFAPQRLRYRHRLIGFDRDWINVPVNHRTAHYTNLWPGRYELQVQSSNRLDEWNSTLLRIPIEIAPAFWQTPWFAGVLLLGLIGIGQAGLRWRTRRIGERARQLELQVAERTAELQRSRDHLAESKAALEAAHTRLIETQQQLVVREKMASLGTLTAGMAHEINNPTNFADGAVQNLIAQHDEFRLFLRQLAGKDADAAVLAAIERRFGQFAEMTATAREGHQRIKAIIRDLRAFTRLDEAEHKTVPIAEPIESAVNLLRARYADIRFELDLAFNPRLDCQPAKLGQAFMNLIINACEAIDACSDGREGMVRITTRPSDDAVEIAIEDNGCGIDAATRERMFEPFFTTKPVGAGTGLGLAIVFGIVREHGGSIDVESTPGVGTRVCLRLPVTLPQLPTSSRTA